jgi:DNA modification methylase
MVSYNKGKSLIFFISFKEKELDMAFIKNERNLIELNKIKSEISKNISLLDKNGILYLYGNPKVLSSVGVFLSNELSMNFKYWISIEAYREVSEKHSIVNTHIGCLMYTHKEAKVFDIDTDAVRTPRFACASCGRNTKDWGGKKHLINKKGAGISDVWKDFIMIDSVVEDPQIPGLSLNISKQLTSSVDFFNGEIPDLILKRLLLLSKSNMNYNLIKIHCEFDYTCHANNNTATNSPPVPFENSIIQGDSVEIMKEWVKKYPEGIFDLIFADPPYNLNKNYSDYKDENTDNDYINWCDEWLSLSAKLLKKDGNMLILNLPKWTLHHIDSLSYDFYLSNNIVWDALSTPKGKIMPAHYALTHFRRLPGDGLKTESELMIYPQQIYCSRKSCIHDRERNREKMSLLSNIWSDVHRIKHKKDRDYHPCQLPDKLMSRIITLFSKPGDLVFDPFSGVGTTSFTSKKLNRRFVSIDISPEYVDIGNQKISEISQNGFIKREKIYRQKRKHTKKELEIYVQNLTNLLGKKPTVTEFKQWLKKDKSATFTENDILELYPSINELLKCGRVVIKQTRD